MSTMRRFVLKLAILFIALLAASQAFAQTLELGMPRDSVMLRMRQARMREGDASRTWDIEIQPVVFADLSGIYTLGFDKTNRLEYIGFNQTVGSQLPSAIWSKVVTDFKKQKLDSLKELHELIGDTYRWKNRGNSYTLTNRKGFMSYTAAAPSAVANPKRKLTAR